MSVKGDNMNNFDQELVLFECPICHTKKKLGIPQQIFNNNKGLIAISIPKGLVCDHTFQSYIDRHFNVRDYLKIDYEVSDIDFYYKISEDLYQNKEETSLIITIICPRCQKKMELSKEIIHTQHKNAQELLINSNIKDHCGHEFKVYIDNNYKILGYSSIKNIDENDDLKEIFSKL